MAKKKRKLEEHKDESRPIMKPLGPLKLAMPQAKEKGAEPEKESGAMMSPPESITAS